MPDAESVARCEQITGYCFRDPSLLTLALTHASMADARVESNERLEFLGDAILGMVVCAELFRRFGSYLEGELTKLKSSVVSRKTCARVADEIGLTPLLKLGKGMDGQSTIPQSMRAAVYESVIGAIFLDGGFSRARRFVLDSISVHIDRAAASDHQENHKSILQQYAQKRFAMTPHYEQLDEQGPDHSKCFEVRVVLGNRRFPSAWGTSKKEAEQQAAKLAMAEIAPGFYDADEDGDGDGDGHGVGLNAGGRDGQPDAEIGPSLLRPASKGLGGNGSRLTSPLDVGRTGRVCEDDAERGSGSGADRAETSSEPADHA